MKVTFTSLTTASFLCLNTIYKRLILAAVYYINLLVTIPDLYPILALYLVSTTYKGETTINTL